MRFQPTILFKIALFLVPLIFISQQAHSQDRNADSLALRAIYNDMGGASWNNNSGWLGPGAIDTWFGVGLSGDRIVTLSLSDNNLSGAVPIEIGNMDALQSLDLQVNQITSIPDEIGNLVSLTTFSIQENQLSSLPAGLGNISGLLFLDVGDNQITTLPNEISNLISLTTLRAGSNQLSSIPSVIDGLSALTQLDLDENQLTILPPELFNITTLVDLQIEENQLTIFPTAITGLTNLAVLGLSDNQFSGAFPNELLGLTNLTDIDLGNNNFNGNIPTGISSLIALTNLNLEGNDFGGTIPTSINSLAVLQSLGLGGNSLSGNIPTEIGSMTSLTSIDLSGNNLDGAVPSSFTGLTNLQELYLMDNALTGLPDLTSITSLNDFIVSGNLIPDPDISANLAVLTDDANQQQFTNATVFSYNVTTTGFGFSTLSSPTAVTLQDDSVTFAAIPIGFDFDFFGSTYNSVYISSNGFISFLYPDINGDSETDNEADGCCNGQPTGNSVFPNAYIAGYWEDLDPSMGGTIQYETLGSEFVVEFNAVSHLDQPETVTFQIKLMEGSNNIEIHCSSCQMDNDAEVATQGIEDELGFQGFALAGREAAMFDATSDAVLFAPQAPPVSTTDSLALVALYNNTDGANWNNNTNWLSGPVETWFGIITDNGRVTEIHLEDDGSTNFTGNGLNGAIPIEIGDLTELTFLNLSQNNLFGSIPNEIGNLTNLEILWIRSNQLSGDIPTSIGNLTNVTSMTLADNSLTGSIPTELGNLINLDLLYLSNNQLSGAIPVSFGDLSILRDLDLSSNQLSGDIPSELGNLINLQYLRLWGNQLTGAIPVEIGSMTALEELDFNGNQLTGGIPPELGLLSNLRVLSMPSNQLTGTIPVEIGDLSNLENIGLEYNQLTGEIPVELDGLINLRTLWLEGNLLSGSVPELPNVIILEELVLSYNQFSGSVPGFIGDNTNLIHLRFNNNNFTGAIPTNFNQLSNLQTLDMRDNSLEDLPDLSSLTSLTFWDVSFNRFGADDLSPNIGLITNNEGQIAPIVESDSLALVAIYNALDGPNWNGNAINWLSDTLAAAWQGVQVLNDRVVQLDLNSFNASGAMPPELGDLDALEVLGFPHNQITSLPDEISQLTNLRSLYIDFNQIEGPIPLAIGSLVALEELFAQGNRFTGTIPDTLSALTNLRSIWLSDNRLAGELPASLTELSGLEVLHLSNNRLTGIPNDLSNLFSLNELNISNNDIDTISATLALPSILFRFDVRGNALREAPDLTGGSLSDYNIESNRIPFSKLLIPTNTSGLGAQNYRYELTIDNQLPTLGGDLTLSLTSDDVNNTFQWFKDGIPLDGETSDTLALSGLEESDAGVYHAEIGNSVLLDVFISSEQFEVEFGVTAKEYAIAATTSSSRKINSLSGDEALGLPNSFFSEDTRAWKPDESDSNPTITLEVENATSFNTLWMGVNSNGTFQSTTSYSVDGVSFTEFPIGFSNTSGPGGNLLRWDFETVTEAARYIRIELDSAQVAIRDISIDAVAIGLNDFTVNRPQDLILDQVVSESIINMRWGGSGFGEGVIIERAINSESFQAIDTALVTNIGVLREPFSYSDRNAPMADSIFYRVRAFDNGAFSEYSNTLELITCPTPTVVNTDNYWFGDADPNSFTGATNPQSEIIISELSENTYNISDISGGWNDFESFGAPYAPLPANFTFSCDGQISSVEILGAPGVSCGGDNSFELISAEYFPGNDSLVFNLRWISCDVNFNSYFSLTNVPSPSSVIPVQEPAIVKSISQPTTDRIQITWQDINENEEFYLIERSIDVDNNFVLIDSVSQINKSNDDPSNGETVIGVYHDEDIASGTTFFYRLITRNATGDSPYSDTLSITKTTDLVFERLLNDPAVTDVANFSYTGYWGDYDKDGDQDLYVPNWQKGSDPFFVAPNDYFYDNNGDGTFTKVNNGLTARATQARAGSWGDMDNDGDLDFVLQLVLSEVNQLGAPLLLYENDNGVFTERVLGEPSTGGFDHVVLGDFDNDGLLDILSKNFIYFNEGDLAFTETSYETLFPEKTGASEPNAHAVDIDMDMDLDIYFGGDAGSFLYINNGDRTFVRSNQLGFEEVGHRGGAWGDFDNDGDFDLFITLERKPNNNSFRYYRNEGAGNFQLLLPEDLGLEVLNLQRGATTMDFNNDGLLDLLSYESFDGNLVVLENMGSSQFQRLEDPSFTPTNSFVSAVSVADYDQDGNQDFFVASGFNSNQSNFIYRNTGSTNNYLRVDLEGTVSNVDGIGSVISVYAAGVPDQTHQVVSINGTWAGNEQIAHFGLGNATEADSVVVNWTSGVKTILVDVAANQLIEIMEMGAPTIAFDSLSLETQEFQPELFGTVNDTSATIEIELQGNFYAAINNMDSTWTLPAMTVDSLFDGTYEVIARATNDIGVGVDTAILVIDQSAPFVSINDVISTVRSPELTGFVDDTTAIITVVIEDNDYLADVNTSDSTWVLAAGLIQPPLEDGTYDVLVLGENRFGVASDTTINELRLDASAPEVFVDNIGTSITSPELTGFINDTTATLTINVAGRGDFTPIINNADSTWSIPEGEITPGFSEEDSPIVITATAEDSLANSSSGTGELIITNTIQALAPSRVTSNSFRANWSAVVDVVSYTFEVSDTEDFSNILETINTTETSYKVEELDFESTYYYRATFDNGVDPPTTSNEVTVNTTIKPGTLDDFNSLALIESSTGGTNWTVPSNWTEDTRKQDWDYITLEDERIVEISIPGNNLTGLLPYTPLMTSLRTIDVSDNALTEIEDLTRLRAIEELNVSDNLYEFDDLEKLRDITSFNYSPQKTKLVFNETSIADSLLVRVFNDTSLSISAKGEYISYKWYLNGNEIDTGEDFVNNDTLLQVLAIDFDNMGKFEAEVTNDSLPDLTLSVDSMFVFAVADFSVNVNDENGALIPDNVDGFLLLTEQRGAGFDTLSRAFNQPSSFTFNDVILGDYLISIGSDTAKYVASYFTAAEGTAFEWVEADTVMFRKDSAFQVSMTIVPDELTEADGEGTLSVILEEDFGDDAGRIDARRRAAKRKCGLRRKRSGGRTGQDDDEFELIAYGETDENGEFQFGFLPQGTYRFFVEYPGIPLDESSEVEFVVGEAGISDTDFKLEAFASEDGIQVEIERVLGVIFEYFKNLAVYPNPTTDILKISYRHLADRDVAAKLIDLSGNVLWTKDIRSGYDGYEEIDVSGFESGIYILHVYDKTNSKKNVASYRIIVRD